MFKLLRNNLLPVLLSLGVHIMLIVMLFISFDWTPKPAVMQNQPNVVKATAVDASKVKAELDKLKHAEQKKKKQEQARVDKLKEQEREAKKRRAAEEKRIVELQKKRAAEEKHRQQEQQRLAKVKQEQAELEKKREQEQKQLAELEYKRKVEQERQRQEEEKRQAEAERKAAEAKRQAAEAKRREDERKKQLAEQLAAEERANAESAAQTEIDKYLALIRQKVTRNWLKPAGAPKGLACTVRVRTIPGGEVVGVTIIKGSGNAIFDRSVESAVRKAAPLPLPRDPAVAARMREIDFEFIPEA